jgi:DNA-binding transcriptional MerR regulator
VRISELAELSGLPVATIKFYLREGLLPAGTPISRTQAEYSDSHLERLRLIRALRDIADLPVATVGTVLAAVDDEELPLLDLLGVTQLAVAGFKGSTSATEDGLELAAELLAGLDWTLTDDSPLLDSLARVLDVLRGEGEPVDAESLRPWADAALAVAEVEMDHIPVHAPRAEAAHTVAVGTVIYGELLTQLRLAAQEAVSLARFGPEESSSEEPSSEEPPATRQPAKKSATKKSPAKKSPVKGRAAKAVPEKAVPAKGVPAKTAPARNVPAKGVPAKAVPAKAVPAKVLPAEPLPKETLPGKAHPARARSAQQPVAQVRLSRRAAGQPRSRG